MSPADMFRSLIMEPLQQLLDAAPGTTVIIIPSVRDMVSDHAVFPQAELRANVIDDPVRNQSTVAVSQLTRSSSENMQLPKPLPLLSQRHLLRRLKCRCPLPSSQRRVPQAYVRS